MAIVVAGVSGVALGQDRETVLKDRQATMKEQGKDIGAVKAYLDGKGDLAQAKAGATGLTAHVRSRRRYPWFPARRAAPPTEGR